MTDITVRITRRVLHPFLCVRYYTTVGSDYRPHVEKAGWTNTLIPDTHKSHFKKFNFSNRVLSAMFLPDVLFFFFFLFSFVWILLGFFAAIRDFVRVSVCYQNISVTKNFTLQTSNKARLAPGVKYKQLSIFKLSVQ